MAPVKSHPSVGDLIADRYELLAPVGSGASARVWVADDSQLKRRVAIKMLHPHLVDDESFVRRFRAEARASAALNHPNVMHIYDAPDGEPQFIVCEFLGGGSLREMIAGGVKLSASQALEVGLETAKALDYAHRAGFVHRDIKPANLLFGDDKRLRIADFGLARALAAAAWTEPEGMLLGTFKYASPEQAKGRPVTGASDLFSLALTLVEAVTGTCPYVRDDVTSTLMARCDGDLSAPKEMGRLVPVVESIGRLDPDDRPDAGELIIEFLAASEDLPRPAPLPFATIDVDALRERHLDPTDEISDVGADLPSDDPDADRSDLTTIGARATNGAKLRVQGAKPKGLRVDDVDHSAPTLVIELPTTDEQVADGPEVDATSGDASGDEVDERRRRRRWPLVLLVLVLLGGGGAGWWYGIRVPTHTVPELVGLDLTEAQQKVSGLGWKLDTRDSTRRDDTSPNEVVEQLPAAGTDLEEGQVLKLVVSLGNPLVAVPEVAGRPEAEAVAAIELLQLELAPEITRPYDEVVPAGTVIAIDAPGASNGQLPKGSVVSLSVSAGPSPRTVPTGLAGQKLEAVKTVLAQSQLGVAVTDEFSDDLDKGVVISVVGEGGQVPRDTKVELKVSAGPQLFPIPDVKGKSATEANNILIGAGFAVEIIGTTDKAVLQTDPTAGEERAKGTLVRVFVRS